MGKKVLIVDDEKTLSAAISLKLAREGYETMVAGNGEEALLLCENNSYDLILLDILMPKVDGWTVLDRLQGKNIKIIVTSNLSQESDILRARNLGVIDFLVKSEVSLSDIAAKVKEYI